MAADIASGAVVIKGSKDWHGEIEIMVLSVY